MYIYKISFEKTPMNRYISHKINEKKYTSSEVRNIIETIKRDLIVERGHYTSEAIELMLAVKYGFKAIEMESVMVQV